MESATIVVPVQNAESTIRTTLQLLLEVMEDRYAKFQIVVEDRNSVDNTVDVVLELARKVPQIQVVCAPCDANVKKHTQRFTFENLDLSEIHFDDQCRNEVEFNSKNTPIDADEIYYSYIMSDDEDSGSIDAINNSGENLIPAERVIARVDKMHPKSLILNQKACGLSSQNEQSIAAYHLG